MAGTAHSYGFLGFEVRLVSDARCARRPGVGEVFSRTDAPAHVAAGRIFPTLGLPVHLMCCGCTIRIVVSRDNRGVVHGVKDKAALCSGIPHVIARSGLAMFAGASGAFVLTGDTLTKGMAGTTQRG